MTLALLNQRDVTHTKSNLTSSIGDTLLDHSYPFRK